MKPWLLVLAIVVPGGMLLAGAWALRRLAKQRAWQRGPYYMEHIASLTPDTLLALPPIRPLKAQRATGGTVERFQPRARR